MGAGVENYVFPGTPERIIAEGGLGETASFPQIERHLSYEEGGDQGLLPLRKEMVAGRENNVFPSCHKQRCGRLVIHLRKGRSGSLPRKR